jgi:hypothetical protein
VSAFSPARRAEVAARAGHRCEYCRLPTRGQVATFPVDHVVPKAAGGSADPGNLALACPHCNAHKWDAVEAADPLTGESVRLFHPRHDAWNEHFTWAAGELIGRTAVGRATVARLRINDPDMVELRTLLADLGVFPEVTG